MKLRKIFIIIGLVIVVAILVIGFKYVSDKKNIVFKLLGNDKIELYVNNVYSEPGFVADLNGQSLNNYVTVNSNLNIAMDGTYKITYTLKYRMIKLELVREVNVIRDPVSDIALNLIGNTEIHLLKGMEYQELGVTAIDYVDGDVSDSLIISGQVDTSIEGEYKIDYTVNNSRNANKVITRKVIVYDYNYQLNIVENNNVLALSFNESSGIVDSIIVNGESIKGNNISYSLATNKEYYITIVDIYGNQKSLYYDFVKPTLSCVATINMSGTSINATATDNKAIIKFRYCIESNCYDSVSTNYTSGVISKNINVQVYDDSNNVQNSSCQVVDNAPLFDSGLKSFSYSNWGYYLYVPSNVRQYEQSPLIIFLHGTGERGSNLKSLENYGFAKYIKDGKTYNSFILMPQLNTNATWRENINKLMGLIEEVKKNYNLNPKKINITGFSLGGGDIANIVKVHPNYFASAVMIAPGNRGSSYSQYFQTVPTKVFNGERDSSSNTSTTQDFVNGIKKIGGEVEYTTFAGMSHNVVDKVFSDDTVVQWILSKSRN